MNNCGNCIIGCKAKSQIDSKIRVFNQLQQLFCLSEKYMIKFHFIYKYNEHVIGVLKIFNSTYFQNSGNYTSF